MVYISSFQAEAKIMKLNSLRTGNPESHQKPTSDHQFSKSTGDISMIPPVCNEQIQNMENTIGQMTWFFE